MHNIHTTQATDAKALQQLYQVVAAQSGGIIRNTFEITEAYIASFLHRTLEYGLGFHLKHPDDTTQIIGEIHAYRDDIFAHRHILGALTILIHPHFQGQGLGKLLFQHFLDTVQTRHPDILRVELFVRASHPRTIAFYEQLGFVQEGRYTNKILSIDKQLSTPLGMCWFNPSFDVQSVGQRS